MLSLAVVALVGFGGLHAATRVLGWAYEIPTASETGYHLLQAGSALSAILSLVLLTADRSTRAPYTLVNIRTPGATHPA